MTLALSGIGVQFPLEQTVPKMFSFVALDGALDWRANQKEFLYVLYFMLVQSFGWKCGSDIKLWKGTWSEQKRF